MSTSRTTIDRREFLTASAACGLGASLLPRASLADSATSRAAIDVQLDDPIGTISPDLYGYLLENLGTVIYDGVWVGEGSKIPNIGGIRKALIDHLREMKATVIRWPGGNFADYYDWQDGIGPRSQRPRRTNMWANFMPKGVSSGPQTYDPNHFGTHEFMQLCALAGGKPFLNANVRSLGPDRFERWVEYCNSPPSSTTMADLRKANGSADPFGVRYWGIGNEVWAAGGDMTVEEYSALYRRFTTNVPTHGLDLAFIACGAPPPLAGTRWVSRFLESCRQALLPVPIHAMSLHYYVNNPLNNARPGQSVESFLAEHPDAMTMAMTDALKFDADEWYADLQESTQIETHIEDCWKEMAEAYPGHKIKIAVDEWGVFYKAGSELNPLNITGQAVTLRNALAAALTLDIFHGKCDRVALANFTGLINQAGGPFLAEGDKFVATPIYHVMRLYAVHQGAVAVRTTFESPSIDFENKASKRTLSGLSGSASLRGNVLTLTVVNPHVNQTCEASITLRGAKAAAASEDIVTDDDIHAQNTFEQPNRVRTVTREIKLRGSQFIHEFPPRSVTRLTFKL